MSPFARTRAGANRAAGSLVGRSGPDLSVKGEPIPRQTAEPASLADNRTSQAQPSLGETYGRGPLAAAGKPAVSEPLPSESGHAFPISKAARAVRRIYRGANVTDALAATGIPRPTWYLWLSPSDQWPPSPHVAMRSPEAAEFAARLRHAIERAQALCGARAQQSVYRAGNQPQGERDWRAHHEWLKHAEATRKRWHEYRELKVQQTGTISHEHRLVQQLPEEDVLELAGEEWRELLPAPSGTQDV